jgi:serine/threonine protein kinase
MSLAGSQIGRFRLLRLLGRGGMGEVYLADDEQLRRQVAIKVIQAEYPDPDATRLFLREARAIAMFNHPHILPLFDFGEASIHGTTLTYMVMPFCKEDTLAAWMQQHRNAALLSPQDVGFIVQQAASALQYAHNHQVVHQDVKPSNFLIRGSEDASGRLDLMLADFGVAKSATATATVSQSVRGTPAYMAPEQWEGTPVPATDQYALAIMAYDLLTGHPPFQGGLGQVMYQHIHVTPQPPGKLNPRVPVDVDTVILHALAKKPEERFASISAFARAFQQALPVDSSGPTIANTPHELNSSDIRAALVISEAEALSGTNRILTLLGGRQVPVSVPAGTHNGQIIRLEGQVEPASDRDIKGALILTITIAPPEVQTFLSNASSDATVINSGSVAGSTSATELAPQGLLQEQTRVSVSVTDSTGAAELAPPSRATVSTETVNRRRGLTALLLVGLALLVAVGSSVGFFYFTRSNQQNPSPSTRSNQQNPTSPTTTSNNQQNPYPPFGTLALDDPLSDNSQGHSWDESESSLGTCTFTGGAYHVNAILLDSTNDCLAGPNFSDFAYQVQMTIVKGDGGGIIFREDKARGNAYYFAIGQQSGVWGYKLWKFSNCNSNNCNVSELRSGSSAAIKTALNQSNLVTIVASGSTIDLYVNSQKIDSVSDSSYSQGQVGVAATDLKSPTEVVFSDAKVWT